MVSCSFERRLNHVAQHMVSGYDKDFNFVGHEITLTKARVGSEFVLIVEPRAGRSVASLRRPRDMPKKSDNSVLDPCKKSQIQGYFLPNCRCLHLPQLRLLLDSPDSRNRVIACFWSTFVRVRPKLGYRDIKRIPGRSQVKPCKHLAIIDLAQKGGWFAFVPYVIWVT